MRTTAVFEGGPWHGNRRELKSEYGEEQVLSIKLRKVDPFDHRKRYDKFEPVPMAEGEYVWVQGTRFVWTGWKDRI